jgi:hypothetical protein
LEKLLSDHPFWTCLKDILDNGATFPLHPISDDIRHLDISYHKDHRNHRSLSKFLPFIDPIISEDIDRGFALPLLLDTLRNLPNTSLASLGCHKQTTINKAGEVIPKYRLTHNQSYPGPSGLSVNLRVKKHLLPPIMYSFVLHHVIHYIVNTRCLYPSMKIFICKVDLDAIYCHCTLSSSTSYESLMIHDGLLLDLPALLYRVLYQKL